MKKILVIGSKGQIGIELTNELRKRYGRALVIATDLTMNDKEIDRYNIRLNVLDKIALHALVIEHNIKEIYHLAAILSVMGEQHPVRTWDVNMHGLLNVLEIAKTEQLKVFWPSSIAVFGTTSQRAFCPQHTVTEPATIYGISKLAGEQWCQYYHMQYGVDVRSLRYPGLISHLTKPGGGTTDYAIEIFHEAIRKNSYTCYLSASTSLPMMHMQDAIRATLELMEAPEESLSIRTSYNLNGFQFTPGQLADEIRKYLPGFSVNYKPDFRQQIADTWPSSVNDRYARKDWGWQPEFDFEFMVKDMIDHLKNENSAQYSTFEIKNKMN